MGCRSDNLFVRHLGPSLVELSADGSTWSWLIDRDSRPADELPSGLFSGRVAPSAAFPEVATDSPLSTPAGYFAEAVSIGVGNDTALGLPARDRAPI
jgi:hypothetical protein